VSKFLDSLEIAFEDGRRESYLRERENFPAVRRSRWAKGILARGDIDGDFRLALEMLAYPCETHLPKAISDPSNPYEDALGRLKMKDR